MPFDFDILAAVITGCFFAPVLDLIALAIRTGRTRSVGVSGFGLLYTAVWAFEYMLDRDLVHAPELTETWLLVLGLMVVCAPVFLTAGTRRTIAIRLWVMAGLRLFTLVTLPVSLLFLIGGTGGFDGGTSLTMVLLGLVGPLALLTTFLFTPVFAWRRTSQARSHTAGDGTS